jgi:2-methylcitrate dehydratase PrpD
MWEMLPIQQEKRNMSATQKIADYIVRTSYANIPDSILRKARECILDSIGVALYGSSFEASRIAFAVVGGSGSLEEKASILGRKTKTLPSLASFVNGVMAHVADFDDTLFVLKGHISCVLMPAVLAVCEIAEGNGKDFLTAFVVGSEVEGKLGRMMNRHYEAGWHSTGTIGALGAAAAASKGLNLDRDKVANALGIAASSASGLRVNFGTMTKSYHVGHAAMVGVLAAQLAEKGFDSSSNVLEDNIGFAKVFGFNSEFSSMAGNLGTDYALNGIMLKPYPSCAGTHTGVDAILKIKDRLNPKLKDVTEIEVRVHPAESSVLFHHNPQTPLEAKFSIEFCLSAALVFGQLGLAEFKEECIFNPHVRDLMGKVKMILDPEMEEASRQQGVLAPVKLRMKLRGGEEICETVWEARGGPSNPMSRDEIREKFRKCARHALPDSRVEVALETIEHLDSLKKMSELTSQLTFQN